MQLSEQFLEALMTVRLVVLLLENAFVQLFQAKSAHKMFGMKLLKHGGNASSCEQKKIIKIRQNRTVISKYHRSKVSNCRMNTEYS